MVNRLFWNQRVLSAWGKRSIVWLSGVRRAGKTTLAHSLQVEYFDCERPRTRTLLADPEGFLESQRGKSMVLDEVHRLDNPSELLKIAADHFPDIRILATGSSTLGASAKFKDTLAGRKTEIWLTPMNSKDLKEFGDGNLERRLLRGGLPGFFLAKTIPEGDFQEWMDAYWAKDIQELFRLERRHSFQKFTELLFTQSGGMFEATKFAKPCEVSRTTISNYLAVLEATYVAHVIRPYSSHKPTEIVAAPKVYGFDTGFVAYYRGWKDLRPEDLGRLWEHYVLNEMHSFVPGRLVHYWRDKQHREVDFILVPRGGAPIAIECKWNSDGFDAGNLKAFRSLHPEGKNLLVAQDARRASKRKYGDLQVKVIGVQDLEEELGS